MNRVIKRMGWAMLIGIALVAGLAILAGALDAAPLVEINGEPMMLAEAGAGQGLLALGGLLLALLIVALVLPFAVLLPLLLVGVVVGGALLVALLALAGALVLVCSPLILFVGAVWLIWRLLRGGSAKTPPKAGATIAG